MSLKPVHKVFPPEMTPGTYSHQLRAQQRLMLKEWNSLRQHQRIDQVRAWAEGADDWLIRRIYELVRHLRLNGGGRFLRWAKGSGVAYQGGGDISDHPYKMALLIFAGQQSADTPRAPFNRQRRHLLGDAMAYADFHDVPAKHLNGFIKQAGLKQCKDKLIAGHREPGFTRIRSRT
jgi:hypothetical protein